MQIRETPLHHTLNDGRRTKKTQKNLLCRRVGEMGDTKRVSLYDAILAANHGVTIRECEEPMAYLLQTGILNWMNLAQLPAAYDEHPRMAMALIEETILDQISKIQPHLNHPAATVSWFAADNINNVQILIRNAPGRLSDDVLAAAAALPGVFALCNIDACSDQNSRRFAELLKMNSKP